MIKGMPGVKNENDVNKIIGEILEADESMENKFAVYRKMEPALKKYFEYDKDKAKLIEFLSKGQTGDRFIQRVNIMGMTHNVDLGEAVKKVMILNGETGKSALGRLSQIFSLRAIEAVSNGVTSRAKFGLIMGLGIYWGIMKKIVNAPKGEKGKTAADEVVQDMGGYMMMPVNAAALYGAASLMNWGVKGKKDFAYFQKEAAKLAEDFAKATSKTGKNKIKTAYKKLVKEVYSQGKWYQKLLRKPASILARGLTPKPGGAVFNKLRGFSGGLLRFLGFMFVISPILMKPIISASRAIFGKTTEVKKEEAEEKARKANKENKEYPPIVYPEDIESQQQAAAPQTDVNVQKSVSQPQTQAQSQDPAQPSSVLQPAAQNTNLAYNPNTSNQKTMKAQRPAMEGSNQRTMTAASKSAERYIPSDEGVKVLSEENLINMYNSGSNRRTMIPTEDEEKNRRRYIPSEDAVGPSAIDHSKDDEINTLLNKADKAEKLAGRYIH